jgi:hypothetical protein
MNERESSAIVQIGVWRAFKEKPDDKESDKLLRTRWETE